MKLSSWRLANDWGSEKNSKNSGPKHICLNGKTIFRQLRVELWYVQNMICPSFFFLVFFPGGVDGAKGFSHSRQKLGFFTILWYVHIFFIVTKKYQIRYVHVFLDISYGNVVTYHIFLGHIIFCLDISQISGMICPWPDFESSRYLPDSIIKLPLKEFSIRWPFSSTYYTILSLKLYFMMNDTVFFYFTRWWTYHINWTYHSSTLSGRYMVPWFGVTFYLFKYVRTYTYLYTYI